MVMTSAPRPDDPQGIAPHDETIVNTGAGSSNAGSGAGSGSAGSGSAGRAFFGGLQGSGNVPVTAEEFQQQLTASGLMTAEELLSFYDSIGQCEALTDAAQLAQLLVDHRRLTAYQAESIAQGQTRGLVLGNYIIQDKLGEGGMGMVFRARHRLMKRIVALKVLPPSMTASADAVTRFHREVEAAAKLQHPNIAGAYDADQADGIHFLVMELVAGPNLSVLVKEIGPLAPPLAMNIISQAARGLAHAHANGVVHRDIKPSNLLVNQEGVVKILDMGLAQLQSSDDNNGAKADLTQSGRIMGTVDYMAPEQALDAKTVDQRADIYSLGCTLYYLLAGRAMSPDGTLTQKLLWHQTEPIPPLHDVCPAAPPKLEEIYRRMVAKKPAERFSTMAEVINALEPLLSEVPPEQLQLPATGVGLSHEPGSSTDYNKRHNKLTMVDRRTGDDVAATIDSSREAISPLPKPVSPLGYAPLLVSLAALGIAAGIGLFMLFAPNPKVDPNQPPGKNGVVAPTGATSMLIVAADHPNARVLVDGQEVGATNGVEPYELRVELPSGEHQVRVEKAGFQPVEQPIKLQPKVAFTLTAPLVVLPGTLELAVDIPAVEVSIDEQTKGTPSGMNPYLLSVDLPPGKHQIRLAAEGYEPKEQAVVIVAGERNQFKTTLTERPFRELLSWLFANAHPDVTEPVTLVTPRGPESISRWADVPTDYSEIAEIQLANSTLSDTDATLLAKAKALQALSLANTQIGDEGIKALQSLTNLRKLDLSGTQITSKALAYLRGMTQLTDLDLRQTKIQDESLLSLAELPKLERLHLSDTAISDQGITHLAKVKSLKLLSVDGTRVTEDGYNTLGKAFEKNPILKAELDPELGLARKLLRGGAVIKIRKAASSADAPVEVTEVAQLPSQRFHIVGISNRQSRDIDDAVVGQFKQLKQLAELDLDGSAISDDGVDALREIPTLRKINLGYLRIAKRSADELSQVLPDAEVVWHGPRDRAAAQWVLEQGGKVRIRASESQLVSQAAALPDNRDFILEEIHLVNLPKLDETELAVCRDLSGLKKLYVSGTKLTAAGLAQITGCHQVELLAITGEQLQGDFLPLIVAQFPALRQLYLADTELDGKQLNQLKKLPELRQLSLAGTPVQDEDLAPLEALPHLTWLSLDGTNITDAALPHLVRLKQLSVLSLDDQLVSQDQQMLPDELLPDQPARRRVQVTDAGLEELESSLKSTRIYHRELDAERLAAKWVLAGGGAVVVETGDNKPVRVERLAALPRTGCKVLLVALTSTSCKPEEITPALRACRNLQSLEVAGFGELRSKHVAALAALESLKALNLSGTGVDDEVFTHLGSLPKLTWLALDSTDITGAKLSADALPALTYFSAATSGLNDAGLRNLSSCAQLESLSVANCRAITDQGFAAIGKLTNLRELNLWQTRITNQAAAAIGKLSKLRTLKLTGTAIGDEFVTQLNEMPDLISIDLANTKVTDASLAHLQGFSGLKKINVRGTAVTDTGAAPLGDKVDKSPDPAERDPIAAPSRFGS